jgi:D-amino-acid dehydrogenase
MGKSVCIIGGGVIGLMNASHLARHGHEVTLIDEGRIEDNTSFGNAGLVSPFEKEPLSHPGVILSTLGLMLRGRSPLIIPPGSVDPRLLRWLRAFARNATQARLKKSLILFERYGRMAVEGYEELLASGVEFEFHRDGLLLVYTEAESYRKKLLSIGKDLEYYHLLDPGEIVRDLPLLRPEKIAGVLRLRRNAHLDPAALMLALKKALQDQGVRLVLGERIRHFEHDGRRIRAAVGERDEYRAETFLMATGADDTLARSLGRRLMMLPAKGYSITFETDPEYRPATAALFADLFIALTPRARDLRLTGKLELGASDRRPDPRRIESILRTFRAYAVDFPLRNPRTWAGNRPLTPNDMPLIGRDEEFRNLVYATGLGWLGITFAPAVAKILGRLIGEDLENREMEDILLFSGFYQGC